MPAPPTTVNAPVLVLCDSAESVIAALLTENAPSTPPESLVPPRSIVELLTYNVLNLAVGLPRSYVSDILGNISPTKVDVLPTYKLPPIPTPPLITKAPVVVEIEAVVFDNIILPVLNVPYVPEEKVLVLSSMPELYHSKYFVSFDNTKAAFLSESL